MTENKKPSWDGAKAVWDKHGAKWHLLSDGTYWRERSDAWCGVYADDVEEEYGPCVVVEDGRTEKGK